MIFLYKNVSKLTGLVTLAPKIIFVAKILFLGTRNVCEGFEFYIMFSNILESSFWTTGKLAHVEIRGKVKF